MKEKIAKIAKLNAEIAKALTDGKTDEAIAKLEEQTAELEGVSNDTETQESQQEEIQKAVEEQIKKYADSYISAESLPDLIEQILQASKVFTEMVGQVTAIAKKQEDADMRIDTIAKTSKGSQQIDNNTQIKKTSGNVHSELSGFFG